MTTGIRRSTYVLVAVVAVTMAVLGAIAGWSGAGPGAVDRTAHTGSHRMADGTSMSDTEMPEMPGMGHGDGPALWATQKAGGTVVVTDGDGNPLYRSDADGAVPPTAEWEPVTLDAGQTPELLGVQRSAVGTVRRADGSTQLTLGGAPLYRHAGPVTDQPDPREFAARGWFVVDPSGRRVTG